MDDRKPTSDLLDWMGIKSAPDWRVARPLGPLLSLLLTLLFIGAIAAAFSVIWHTVTNAFGNAADGPSLGAGAMIAALLGAPFVIWGTVLRHQTLRYQKEGHITDRITSAVEQLGAEKNVDRIGRPVTIWTGTPVQVSCGAESKDKYLQEPRSTVMGSEWSQRYNESTDEVWEGRLYDIYTWPTEKTIIQWQGEEVSLEGTDRVGKVGAWQVFTESVPNIEVRIGAILSLERIAQDSTMYDKGRDHVRVMEILCAYVRENSPAGKAPDFAFPQGCNQDSIEEKRKSTLKWLSNEFTLRADVQLALSVIGRRTREQVRVEKGHLSQDGTGYRVDLSRTNLRYADLQYLNFENATFFRSQMQVAFCKGANFKGANLVHCELTGVSAENADLSNSKMEIADFSYATLTGANLCGCKVSHTHFVRTNLRSAQLRFRENVRNTEVKRAFFIDSDLKGALIGGDLLGVVFSPRILQDEKIPRDVYGVGFQECRVAGQRRIFGNTHHESAIPVDWLRNTFGDASVILTEGMDRPTHWPDWRLPSQGDHSFSTEWCKWQANPEGYVPPPAPAD
ncbi:secreted effector protein pipB2 [Roseovarius sp. A-2]|uniref:pentapeptide repeat-containing protein n=1 Tax=Roseovarius sp. A-2 TaxID=1570360 RepID=UPI0009B552D7|nr:pentapeptide repeat-containing protein [Roseovarius sp. A-2]GAW33270.1 secreted effector protein pipB2 [Roseovarius sp. A-2]